MVGCYGYYPPPASALEELRIAQVEACSAALTGDHQLAEQCIDWAADLTRRLEVGVYIRHFWLSDDCRQRTKTLRDLLEQLDHAIEDDEDADSIRELALGVSHAYRECRTAYSP